MHLEEHGGDQPKERFVVGKDLDDVGAALDLAVDALQWVGRLDLLPMSVQERREGGEIVLGFQRASA